MNVWLKSKCVWTSPVSGVLGFPVTGSGKCGGARLRGVVFWVYLVFWVRVLHCSSLFFKCS